MWYECVDTIINLNDDLYNTAQWGGSGTIHTGRKLCLKFKTQIDSLLLPPTCGGTCPSYPPLYAPTRSETCCAHAPIIVAWISNNGSQVFLKKSESHISWLHIDERPIRTINIVIIDRRENHQGNRQCNHPFRSHGMSYMKRTYIFGCSPFRSNWIHVIRVCWHDN